jgi:hypothetical protein
MNNLFKEEIKSLNIILNKKNVIQNIIYKLRTDKNVGHFIDNLISNSKKYNEMGRMDKYYFNNNLKEFYDILSMLIEILINDSNTKNKSADEIVEPCIIFPDRIGESLMEMIGIFPIIKILEIKRKNTEYFKKLVTDEDLEFFSHHPINPKFFPEEKKFVDQQKINKFIEDKKEKFLINERDVLDPSLLILLEFFNESSNESKVKQKIGKEYWNQEIFLRHQKIENFSKIMESISNKI